MSNNFDHPTDCKKNETSIKKIKFSNKTFVHRDFHVSNLMIQNKKLCVIDSQDAVFGNIAYDVASLVDDVRLKTSIGFKKILLDEYIKTNKNIPIVSSVEFF